MQFQEICSNLKGDQIKGQDFCPLKQFNVYLFHDSPGLFSIALFCYHSSIDEVRITTTFL